ESFIYNKSVNLYGNPLIHPIPEIVKEGRQAVIEYFQEYDKGNVQPLNEAKLILIGAGNAGKTTLVK
ncbi:MAG: hypothetical protein AAF518_11080, partial [Spirochaetota bacterium]